MNSSTKGNANSTVDRNTESNILVIELKVIEPSTSNVNIYSNVNSITSSKSTNDENNSPFWRSSTYKRRPSSHSTSSFVFSHIFFSSSPFCFTVFLLEC